MPQSERTAHREDPILATQTSEAAALYVLTDRLYRARALNEMFDAALDAITRTLACERASVLLFDEAGVMRFAAWRGLSDRYRSALEGHTPWSPGQRDAQPIFVEDIDRTQEPDRVKAAVKQEGIRALGFVPLIDSGGVVGKFMTYYARPRVFTRHEIDLAVTIARQVSFSIERARVAKAHRLAQDSLRESEERFRLAVEAAPSAMLMAGADGRIVMANIQAEQLFGYSRDELIGQPVELLVPARFRDSHPGQRHSYLAQPIARPMGAGRDLYGVRKDGIEVPVEIGLSSTQTPRGPITLASIVDISARKQHEAQRELLLAELSHRVKNTLAVVQGIASQTFKPDKDPSEAKEAFEGRLHALSVAHDLLIHSGWQHVSLEALAAGAARILGSESARLTIAGPYVELSPRQALDIGMALHELFTNAMKYGALSNDTGEVRVEWTETTTPERLLHLNWRESGGPSVSPPKRRGFGSLLLERSLGRDLGGDVVVQFRPEGLVCEITARLDPKRGLKRT